MTVIIDQDQGRRRSRRVHHRLCTCACWKVTEVLRERQPWHGTATASPGRTVSLGLDWS